MAKVVQAPELRDAPSSRCGRLLHTRGPQAGAGLWPARGRGARKLVLAALEFHLLSCCTSPVYCDLTRVLGGADCSHVLVGIGLYVVAVIRHACPHSRQSSSPPEQAPEPERCEAV